MRIEEEDLNEDEWMSHLISLSNNWFEEELLLNCNGDMEGENEGREEQWEELKWTKTFLSSISLWINGPFILLIREEGREEGEDMIRRDNPVVEKHFDYSMENSE